MNFEQADIKTLKDAIKQTPGNSREMVDLLNTLNRKLRLSGASFNESGELFKNAQMISRKINYPDGEAMALCFWGIQNLVLQRKKEGLKILESSLEFIPKVSQKTIARLYSEYGFYLQEFGEFDRSFEYLEKALNLARQLNDTGIQSRTYYYFGRLSYFLNEIDDCLTYLRKSISFDDPQPSLGQLFDSVGYIFYIKGEYQKAILSFNRALTVRHSYDTQSLINIETNLGLCLQKMGKTKEAETRIKNVVSILNSLGNPMQQTMFLNDIAEFYFDRGSYEKSMEYRDQISGIALSDDNKNMHFLSEFYIGECLLKLGDIYQTQQHFLLLISKLESHTEKELPNINSLLHKCYATLASLYQEINMEAEKIKFLEKAEYYKSLMAANEVSQKTKKLTAKIKMEEFKMTSNS